MHTPLDSAPCGYFSLSNKGIILEVNKTLLDMLGFEREELLQKHIETILSVTNKLFFHTYFSPHIELYGHVDEMYFSLRSKDKQDIPVLLNGIRQERDGISCIDCIAVVMRKRIEIENEVMQSKLKLEELYKATHEANKQLELTNHQLELLHAQYERKQQELIQINSELETFANTDALTGLKNRRYFRVKLLAALAEFQQSGTPLSLLIIDIDYFKKINDTYGHPIGDLVLAGLAQLLQSKSREHDLVARFGGEEFVIMLPNTSADEAVRIAEQYRLAAETTQFGEYKITVSIGVSTAVLDDTKETLLEKADQALYVSKSNGRNRVTHSNEIARAY